LNRRQIYSFHVMLGAGGGIRTCIPPTVDIGVWG
jgi:hypothetical protein